MAGPDAPDHGVDAEHPVIIDLDATLITAHSRQGVAATDVQEGLRVPPVVCLRRPRRRRAPVSRSRSGCAPATPGRTPPPTTSPSPRQALAQLPRHRPGTRPGQAGADPHRRRRCDPRVPGLPGCPTAVLLGRVLACRPTPPTCSTLIPTQVWAPAYDADGEVRDGAWVAELTDLLNLTGWPAGMRVIVRKERPHPGAQLRITDVDGHRVTAFVTNTTRGQLADLELRHRRRARCEDRIRNAKDTGLTQPPAARLRPEPDLVRHRRPGLRPHRLDADARLRDTDARRWEPKRLRLRLFTVPAALATSARTTRLHIADKAPWAHLVDLAIKPPTRARRTAPHPLHRTRRPQPHVHTHQPEHPSRPEPATPRRHSANCPTHLTQSPDKQAIVAHQRDQQDL